ncbi:hypothetical protein [Roseibium aggregatum]|uniref:hypothetical protein n=1 Tax=Roseibium aggregatum TaxID=187304 RepID=UPI0016761B71|nr:hypothetical protein [Roseibium aggregatum]UFI04660.1 hypothetical protein ST40_005880 [Roseibium aggregatum]
MRLMRQSSETAGLRLDRTEDGRLRLVPVIPRGNPLKEAHRQTLRLDLHKGVGTLWLSDQLLKERGAFSLTNPNVQSVGGLNSDGCWRRCLPLTGVSKDGDFLPSMPTGDPLWRGLDALHVGSLYRFYKFRSDDDTPEIEPIEIGEPIDEDERSTETASDNRDGSLMEGWANPIVLQFTADMLEEQIHNLLAPLLQDASACLDMHVTLAGPQSGSAEGELATRFWLHNALRARVLKAGYANAPLPRLIFGPDASPGGALAFLLLDLQGGQFRLDVAAGQRARPSEWIAPSRRSRTERGVEKTVREWLCALCCAHLGLNQVADRGDSPRPIPSVRDAEQLGTEFPPMRLGSTTGSKRTTLAERMTAANMPAVLRELAEALDHSRDSDAPGAMLASKAAEVLGGALASSNGSAVGRAQLIERVANVVALPRSPILLRFPDPPNTLDETETENWRKEAKTHCIGLVESAHGAAGVWWLAGLGEALVAPTPEPSWSLHEVHWAARLYRAAFVQAAPAWCPKWKVEVAAGGLGKGLLGTLLLGGGGGPRPAAMLPSRTRITDVLFQLERTVGS